MECNSSIDIQALNENLMRTKDIHNLLVPQKQKTDLGGISGKNFPVDRLVKLVCKFAKLIIKTNSKMRELKTYDEAINNLVHKNKWQKAIDEEFWNLNSHQTWSYTTLPSRWKIIGYKYVLKIKYYLDGSIKRYKTCLVTQSFF